uniref:Lipase domain-containing protein n=1 Tax=Anopheles atroparvus TaxID=41427 RepID=A0A182J8V4_ANOAO
MPFERKALWAALALSCVLVANGQMVDLLSYVAEAPLAAVLDASVQPPPRTTGFETLVPQENIRLHCAKPSAAYYEEVFFGDISVGQKINFSQPLTVVIHGWTENSNLTQYNSLSSRYRRFVPDANFCLLDWRPYAQFNYMTAARKSVPLVAQLLFGFLQNLSVLYYPLERVTLVGFSMGGQISALASKSLSGRIGTIYALDPAGPLFTHPFDVGTTKRLTKTDAQFIQVIYTSRYAIGMGPIVGHQNFLPNRGYHPQDPCKSLALSLIKSIRCSHEYAVTLFTATLDPAAVITGQKCINILGSPLCIPGIGVTDRVGIHSKRFQGDFYL